MIVRFVSINVIDLGAVKMCIGVKDQGNGAMQ